MLSPLDPAALPKNVTALRTLLLSREQEHAAELEAAREGLKEQVLQNEQLKARLAKLLRQRFGASSEKMRGAIDQLELIIGDLEEKIAETSPPEPEPEADPSALDPEIQPRRRKPKRKALPENLPRDVVEHAPACACPKCGGALRRLGEDVTEVLEYVPGSFRVTRHVRPKMSCRCCENITQPPAPSLPINRGLAGPGLLAHVLVGKFCDHLPLHRQAEIYRNEFMFGTSGDNNRRSEQHPLGRWPPNIMHDGSPEVENAFAAFEDKAGESPSRFFYGAKASKSDRGDSLHPCIKPLAVMTWLVKLITPTGGRILEPFGGTGMTGLAACLNGFDVVLIERERDYIEDMKRRLAPWT